MELGLFREGKLQSEKDIEQIQLLKEYIRGSHCEDIIKFDNFPKYVQRSAISKFIARYEIYKLQLNVPGSIVELGVGRGASLMEWAQLCSIFEPVNYSREIIGFDTFEGIPVLDAKDKNPENNDSNLLREKGFKVENNIYDDISKAIKVYDANRYLNHINKVRLIKGDINESLPRFLADNPQLIISLLNIDVDIYRPTKIALELLLERIPKGGVVIFDELNSKEFPGETIALKEVLGINSLRLIRFPWATTISYAVIE